MRVQWKGYLQRSGQGHRKCHGTSSRRACCHPQVWKGEKSEGCCLSLGLPAGAMAVEEHGTTRITARPGGSGGGEVFLLSHPLLVPLTDWAQREVTKLRDQELWSIEISFPGHKAGPARVKREGEGADKWKVTPTIFTAPLWGEDGRHHYSHFPDEKIWSPERSSQEPTEGTCWSRNYTPCHRRPNLVLFWLSITQAQIPSLDTGSPGVHTRVQLALRVCVLPTLSVIQHVLSEHKPELGPGVPKPVCVSYHSSQDYFMLYFLPSKPPLFPCSPSWSPLLAVDLTSHFTEQVRVSSHKLWPLPTTKCPISCVSTFRLLLLLDLEMCPFAKWDQSPHLSSGSHSFSSWTLSHILSPFLLN